MEVREKIRLGKQSKVAQTIKILDGTEFVPIIWYKPKQVETTQESSPRKLGFEPELAN